MSPRTSPTYLFFFNDTATTEIYTLSLHDALPISTGVVNGPLIATRNSRIALTVSSGNQVSNFALAFSPANTSTPGCLMTPRSEEHTSELQSRPHLVCRLLLEKKKSEIKSPTPPYR